MSFQSNPSGRRPSGPFRIIPKRTTNVVSISSNASPNVGISLVRRNNSPTNDNTRNAVRNRAQNTFPADAPPVKNASTIQNMTSAMHHADSAITPAFDSMTSIEIRTRPAAIPSNCSPNSRR
nr:hypothetical protein OHA15_39640 [Streptomyces anthocyanicus]WTC13990.1 hypothetical protein OHA15_39870 [Streptomyces anthocyanicus]